MTAGEPKCPTCRLPEHADDNARSDCARAWHEYVTHEKST